MNSRIKKLHNLAKLALLEYPIEVHQLSQVGHISGNLKFLVESENDRFLLSVQYPIPHKQYIPLVSVIESHLLWLEALNKETNIVVQKPIPNRSNEVVTCITSQDDESDRVLCSLLSWIDGEPIKFPHPKHIKHIGGLMAQLHKHTQKWKLPEQFIRPSLDADDLSLSLNKLQIARDDGRISKDNFDILFKTAIKIQQAYLDETTDPKKWGLIHNDLVPGNCLFYADDIRPIDFDNCGFGYYLYDLAWVLNQFPSDSRRNFMKGYSQIFPLSQEHWSSIEAFMIMSKLRTLSWWVGNQNHQFEYIPKFVQDLCINFLEDKPFLFTTT